MPAIPSSTVQSIFWVKTTDNRFLKEFLMVLGAAFLLSITSQLSIPLQPVPLTFQSITVLFIGMTLGMRLGAYSIVLYLISGCAGLPVFANFSGGMAVFAGPTAGYLIGFLPAAALSGFLAQKGFAKSIITSFITALLGTLLIFAVGITVLSQFTGWEKAFTLGLKPFVLTETIKILALSFFIPRCWKNG